MTVFGIQANPTRLFSWNVKFYEKRIGQKRTMSIIYKSQNFVNCF